MQAPAAFKAYTVKNEIQLPDQSLPSFGQTWQVDCMASGYLAGLDVMVFGTITTGTSTSGSWAANYFPWNILSRLQLFTNQGIYLFDAGGYSAFLIDSLKHRTYQQAPTPPASGGFNNTGNTGPRTGIIIAPSGSLTDATAYKFMIHYRIPVAVDDGLSHGLVLLQNQATRLSVKGVVGAATDWGTLGTGATITGTVRVLQQSFSVPPLTTPDGKPLNAQPDLSFLHQWIEQEAQFTATGDQLYQMPLGGTLCRLLIDIQNNGAPQAFFSSASDPTATNLGQLQIQFGGSQRPIVKDYRFLLNEMRYNYGFDLPQGFLVHDFSLGAGSIELGFDGRDTFDTDLLTDFTSITNISATPTAGKIRYIRELLLRQQA